MKTIGLVGGMSWESTASYYKALNEGVKDRLGGLHSAKICLYSVDFDEIEKLQHQGKWSETALILADATAESLVQDGVTKVGLLGTRFTMEQDFYKGRITEKFGIEVVVPSTDEQTVVHDIIYQELCLGEIKSESRKRYLKIIANLHTQGAQAVILGCTEIALLVKQSDTTVPLYDTTEIHAAHGVEWALGN
ncbi:aspartate/glutamate racemase family protein [Vibrio sp. FJH11]